MLRPFVFLGWLAIIFGILVIAYPAILADLVGIFFIIVGLNIVIAARNSKLIIRG